MPKPRLYADAAEKQKAYRERRKQQQARPDVEQTAPALATAPPRLDSLETPADVQADMQARRELMDTVGL